MTSPGAETDDPGTDDSARHPVPAYRVGALGWFGIGVASAILGLLPWIITGMRLPLQNLWDEQTLPARMPIALLPFSQYTITLVLGLIIVGSAIAGLVARLLSASRRRDHAASASGGLDLAASASGGLDRAASASKSRHLVASAFSGRHLAALAVGLLGIQSVAAVQAGLVTGEGLSQGRESTIYLAAVCGVAVVAIVTGAIVFFAIARMPRPAAAIAISVGAVASAWWVGALLIPLGSIPGELQLLVANTLQRWLPAVIVGLAIAWCGIRSIGRVIAAIAMLGILVIVPTLATAVTSAVGTRVLARYPAEMLDYGVQVFRSALAIPELTVWPAVLAIVVAVVGFIFVRRRLRSR